jgi:hypothetical protein
MARNKVWGTHGTVRRYRQGGCDDLKGGNAGMGPRCAECRSAMSLHNRDNQANRGVKLGSVTSIAGHNSSNAAPAQSNQNDIGFNEAAIISGTEQYRESNPAFVALAISAARDLDNPDLAGSRPTMMRNLTAILEKLDASKKKKSRGRLAAVQSMTTRSASG